MNIYECPECGKKFLECELINFKCSENHIGPKIQDWCPNCIKKYKYIKLTLESNIEDDIFENNIFCDFKEIKF